MTSTQLRKILDKAQLSQRGAARLLGINERTMRHYCAGNHEIPKVVELALRCLAEHSQVNQTAGEPSCVILPPR